MRIPANFIEEIKYRNNIEDVISSYVTLKRAGSNYSGLCPFHSEKTPSFTVFPGSRSFYCFCSGSGGDVISFLMKAENLDYVSAVERLAQRAGLPMPAESESERGVIQKRERILAMNREAAKFFHAALFSPAGEAGLRYLRGRGLEGSVIRHFGLGFAPDGFGALTEHLHRAGYTDAEMKEGFLCGISQKTGRSYDYFRNRVIFPIIDTAGRVVAFGGRVMDDSKPKYLNTSDTPAFKKSRNLFALNFAKQHCAEQMILCEGYMDVIALHRSGFENAVATLGTAITPEHARIMARYTKCVVIAYDMDGPGRAAADRAIGILQDVGLEIKVLKMEGAKDPDEYILKNGPDRFRMLLRGSENQINYRCEAILSKYHLENIDEKMKAATELVGLLATLPSQVEREVFASRMAKRLSISAEALENDIKAELRRRRSRERREETKEQTKRLAGYADRVNPERAKYQKAAAAEEAILGILLLYPEMIPRVCADGENTVSLCPDEFLTEFHKSVYAALCDAWRQRGSFDFGLLNESFTQEQISRIAQLSVRRRQLQNNTYDVLLANIEALREEAQRRRFSDGKSFGVDDLNAILQKKRKKEK